MAVPVRASAGQRCCVALDSDPPGRLTADHLGNQTLRIDLSPIPPRGARVVRVRATLELTTAARSAPAPVAGAFLAAEPLIEADDPQVMRLAAALTRASPSETARAINAWVHANLTYAGYLRDARGARYALAHRRGDCTELAYLFTALARAAGLPARVLAGYLVTGAAALEPARYHNWAEVYLDGAWRISDPQQGIFDAGYGGYVATAILAGPDPPRRFSTDSEALTIVLE